MVELTHGHATGIRDVTDGGPAVTLLVEHAGGSLHDEVLLHVGQLTIGGTGLQGAFGDALLHLIELTLGSSHI